MTMTGGLANWIMMSLQLKTKLSEDICSMIPEKFSEQGTLIHVKTH